ncbi:hypothetical protein LTR91_022539 [Friedmanniomyces endolithicus]|uniref:Uncharacterized protein n=1 Tax=Friedmanniomyces endolithicus TaxID=329885 RepID=A0AAN6JZ59_9PEZI|nr:hypothetical protein LTR94_008605 [Friedmanniomyces endolithicus]KAK0841597.1 hypothetical protein LTS02_016786 [Friedmanniomyces endolithicus]KAK0866596.1 hypothetical protein LTR87_014943 [Friedmanniomyces endolithicus]KAK0894840.1 hypothetical protein LTR57_023315 [Friedmanniomyces endolithicus]KAK0956104.1 hypothetical protein LTR91_022539 [Friedmanniomyces endolithicus]
MASLTNNNNAMEMQYKPAEPMQASPSSAAQSVDSHRLRIPAAAPEERADLLGDEGWRDFAYVFSTLPMYPARRRRALGR